MRLRNTKVKEINLTGGIDAWNREAFLGTDPGVTSYQKSHPMYRKELKEGFLDDIVNFDYMDDGSLIQRGDISRTTLAANKYPNAPANSMRHGIATRESQHDGSNERYLIYLVTNVASPYTVEFYRPSDDAVWCTFTTTAFDLDFSAVFYNGKWYVFGDSGNLAWTIPTGGAPQTATAFTPGYAAGAPVSGISEAGAIIWKDRCWGINGTYMNYSKATDPQLWSTANGGGFFQLPNKVNIADFVIYNDQMYIIDTGNNVWVFSYFNDPGVDGAVRKIINGSDIAITGTSSQKVRKLCVSNNQLFVCSAVNVWQIINDQLYPIATQLHLELNGHDEVKLFDLGYALLLATNYQNVQKNGDYYIYHHNVKAWTRYTFDIGQIADSVKYYLELGHLINQGYSQTFIMVFEGTPLPNTNYLPFFQISRSGYFNAGEADEYLTATDGTGAVSHRACELKIKTGPLYVGMKQQYKKFVEFMFDGYFAYRQEGDAPNLTPFKTTVDLVPDAIADKVLSTMQRTSMNDPTEHTYRVPIHQRARAVQLTLELEDREDFGATHPSAATATHEVTTRVFIKNLFLLYRQSDMHRAPADSTAHTDNALV